MRLVLNGDFAQVISELVGCGILIFISPVPEYIEGINIISN